MSGKSGSVPDELLGDVERGDELKRSEPSSIAQVQALGEAEVIHESVIRDILTGKNAPQNTPPSPLDPMGIRIRGARISGALNLDGITTTIGLRLTGCLLDEPLTLCDATMHCLVLDTCVLPAAWADRAKVDTLTIKDCLVNGSYEDGALRLTDAHVTIDLRLTRTRITNAAGPAVQASGLAVDAGAYLNALDARGYLDVPRVPGTDAGGVVNLAGATVGGDLVLRDAVLTADARPAFRGENLTVKGAALLDGDFTATGGGELGALCLANASVSRQLSLQGAAVTGHGGPAFRGDLLTVQASLLMDQGFKAKGEGELAAVRLKGAKVSGDLRLDGATLTNASGPSLAAGLLTVQGDMTMTGTGRPAGGQPAPQLAADEQPADLPNATAGDEGPAVQLRGASITGRLSLAGATIASSNPAGAAASADAGAVCLSGATIGGDLVLRHATLRSAVGPALLADYLTVKGDAFVCEQDEDAAADDQLRRAFRAAGEGDLGAVCLAGATISGQVSMRGAILEGSGGPALVADSVTVQGDMVLDKRFTAHGSGRHGAVRLRGATLNGRLLLDDAVVTSSKLPGDDGAALADYKGAFYLSGATIGHDLMLRRTRLTAASGPALRADYLTVKGDAFRCEASDEGCEAAGTGRLGAVLLAAATLNGQLSLLGATLTNACGPALVADSATIQGDAFLGEGFTATGGRRAEAASGGSPYPVVSLVEASVGRELCCRGHASRNQAELPVLDLSRAQVGTLSLSKSFALDETGQPSGNDLLRCDGLKYAQRPVLLAGDPPVPVQDTKQADEWTRYLREHTVYSAQAYQQLASAYQAQGDDDTARRILISQRDDALDRGGLSRFNKFWQRVLGLLIGYGYRSVKALYWLAGLFVVTAVLAVSWLGPTALIQPVSTASGTTATAASKAPATAEPMHCSFTAQLSYAIDIAFPIVTISGSSEQQCDVPATNPNQYVVAIGWLVRALSATLLAIYVAGLTGLTSRTPGS